MDDFFVNNNMGAISLLSPNVHSLGLLSFTSHLSKMVAQMVRNLPAVWEMWVQSLGPEDPQGKTWQPTAVFLPGELHEEQASLSLMGYSV